MPSLGAAQIDLAPHALGEAALRLQLEILLVIGSASAAAVQRAIGQAQVAVGARQLRIERDRLLEGLDGARRSCRWRRPCCPRRTSCLASTLPLVSRSSSSAVEPSDRDAAPTARGRTPNSVHASRLPAVLLLFRIVVPDVARLVRVLGRRGRLRVRAMRSRVRCSLLVGIARRPDRRAAMRSRVSMAGASPRFTLRMSVPPFLDSAADSSSSTRFHERASCTTRSIPGEHQIAFLDAGEAQVRVVGHAGDDRAFGDVEAPGQPREVAHRLGAHRRLGVARTPRPASRSCALGMA